MNIKMIPIILILLLSIGGTIYLTRSWRSLDVCHQKNTEAGLIVFWNKTDSSIEVAVKQLRHESQVVLINKSIRACLTMQAKSETNLEMDPLAYIYLTYEGRKYRFSDTTILNAFPDKKEDQSEGKGVRHFVVFLMSAGVGEWENVKARIEADNVVLDDHAKYLVLSNYPKLSDFWDKNAKIALMKLR